MKTTVMVKSGQKHIAHLIAYYANIPPPKETHLNEFEIPEKVGKPYSLSFYKVIISVIFFLFWEIC